MIENPEQQTNRYQEQVAEVKRSKEVNNAYFNTVGNYDYNLGISAILDEGLKVVQGSRVRIRLLEEATIGEFRLQPGEYLYGIVSGFSAQIQITHNFPARERDDCDCTRLPDVCVKSIAHDF